jgi:hypothetical protein
VLARRGISGGKKKVRGTIRGLEKATVEEM